MGRGFLSDAELRALIGEFEPGQALADGSADSALDTDDRKLLHALVRNQLRLLHMIEEMQSELRMLKAVTALDSSLSEASAGLEPLPLPFMKQSGASDRPEDEQQKAPAAESRKERHKRRSLW